MTKEPQKIKPLYEVKKYISEILQAANDAFAPSIYIKDEIAKDPRLTYLLGYAIRPDMKLGNSLPIGDPPYKTNDYPLGLAPLDPLKIATKMHILLNPAVKQYKKEEMYIRWLEEMNQTDIEILIAVKDQKLELLYPNLTKKTIAHGLGWTPEQINKMFGSK